MFTTPTVFILGAGASWHYGYPTGEVLVKKLIEKANLLPHHIEYAFLSEPKAEWALGPLYDQIVRDAAALKAGLEQVKPLLIDFYLGWNVRLQPVGRLLIAWVILECERKRLLFGGNTNRKEDLENSPYGSDRHAAPNVDINKFNDDWSRFLIDKLAIGCKNSSDLLRNDVQFVTFNYDVSLEVALYAGLGHIDMFTPEDVQQFLGNNRIMHVYGKVREVPPAEPPPVNFNIPKTDPTPETHLARFKYAEEAVALLNAIHSAALGLRVIDPHDKSTDAGVIQAAREAIARAKSVYILGYGFDENNSERLALRDNLGYEKNVKEVLFTNFGNIERVNKRASKLFFGNMNHFSSQGPGLEHSDRRYHYERSTRNVYDALNLDFESLEEI
jgi:hypothetical protein